MEFGLVIKNARLKKGMSARELSKRIGMSSNYISSLESGKTKLPSKVVAMKIFDELSISDGIELMASYGIIESKDKIKTLLEVYENNNYDEIKRELHQEIDELDLELLNSLNSILKKDKKLINDLNVLLENNKKSFSSLKDYLEFLISKI